jgi:hypothetical protein
MCFPASKSWLEGNESPLQRTTATDVYSERCASELIGAANRAVLISAFRTLGVTSYFGSQLARHGHGRDVACACYSSHCYS